MDIKPIEMDPRVANIHYRDYRKKVTEHQDRRRREVEETIAKGEKAKIVRSALEKEDEVLMHSYRALSKGMRILNVADVIRNGGLDANGLPRVAIAGADWGHCHIHREHDRIIFAEGRWIHWDYGHQRFQNRRGERVIAFLETGFPEELRNPALRNERKYASLGGNVKALVPSVPAYLRPTGSLTLYTILWEAEWDTTPPVDPLLLRHIAGNMYSVLAQWDLTPLEQAVLEGRIG